MRIISILLILLSINSLNLQAYNGMPTPTTVVCEEETPTTINVAVCNENGEEEIIPILVGITFAEAGYIALGAGLTTYVCINATEITNSIFAAYNGVTNWLSTWQQQTITDQQTRVDWSDFFSGVSPQPPAPIPPSGGGPNKEIVKLMDKVTKTVTVFVGVGSVGEAVSLTYKYTYKKADQVNAGQKAKTKQVIERLATLSAEQKSPQYVKDFETGKVLELKSLIQGDKNGIFGGYIQKPLGSNTAYSWSAYTQESISFTINVKADGTYTTNSKKVSFEDLPKELQQKALESMKVAYSAITYPEESDDEEDEECSIDLNLEQYLNSPQSHILRAKQRPIVRAVQKFFEHTCDGGLLQLPTGLGKTVIAGQIARAVYSMKQGDKILFVVPKVGLIDQTRASFNKFAPELKVGVYSSVEKSFRKETGFDQSLDVLVTTYESVVNLVNAGVFKKGQFKLIFRDEAHRSLGEKRKKALSFLEKEETCVIYLTASPDFSANKSVRNYARTIYKITLPEAIREGMLSGARAMVVRADAYSLKGVSLSEREVAKFLNKKGIDDLAIELCKLFPSKKKMIRVGSTAQADRVAQALMSEGISAIAVHSKLTKTERKQIREDFRQGKYTVAVQVGVWTEGFDDPTLEMVINLVPTRSPVVCIQFGGRVLRIDDNNPDKVGIIIDVLYGGRTDQALFIDVLEGAFILPNGSSRAPLDEIDSLLVGFHGFDLPDGIELVYEEGEVVELLGRNKKKSWTFETLRDDVRSKGVKTSSSYKNLASANKWWSVARLKNHPQWTNWDDFFDRG